MKRIVLFGVACVSFGLALGRLAGPSPAGADPQGTPVVNGDANGDGAINLADAVYLLNWLFVHGEPPVPIDCPPAGRGMLPATGQTTCYDREAHEVPCDGADVRGMDGFHQAGCPREGRFVDNGDGTVSDACTGLMWQQDTADVTGDGKIGDSDRIAFESALAYCEDLRLAGRDDWRLPNLRELESLSDYSTYRPAIDPIFGALPMWYWSSSYHAHDPNHVWFVHFSGGYVGDGPRNLLGHVRAVRAAR